jgi:hypothetical protein
MWPFEKKKILDLTSSKIKVPESVRARLEKEYKDTSSTPDISGLGFLGAMASSADSQDSGDNINFKHLKVKIEDVEYKLDNLSKRLASFIDRIDLAEKKIDRIERKGV